MIRHKALLFSLLLFLSSQLTPTAQQSGAQIGSGTQASKATAPPANAGQGAGAPSPKKSTDQNKRKDKKNDQSDKGNEGAGGGLQTKPAIIKVEPDTSAISEAPQELSLTLSGVTDKDKDKVTITFKDPSAKSQEFKDQVPVNGVIKTSVRLNVPGAWTVTAKTDSIESSPRSFTVTEGKTCHADANSPEVWAFKKIFKVMNLILAGLFIVLIVGLIAASFSSQKWSLGDALSEESSVQPKDITNRDQVKMVASSSRVIAVFGLTGILALVVGIGYSIVWHLVVCGTTPNLSPIKAFLIGMATIFAPYLANQLRETISPTEPKKEEQPKPAVSGGPKITGLLPPSPVAGPAAQDVNFLGSDFQTWMGVTLINPDGQTMQVPANNVHVAGPTQCTVTTTVDRGGTWKAVIVNPTGDSSPPFIVKVAAPRPNITGIAGANAGANAGATANATQTLDVTGTEFMPNVKATLISGGTERKVEVTWLNAGQVQVRTALNPPTGVGSQIKLQNPGNDQVATRAVA